MAPLLLEQLPGLRSGISLGEWKKTNPGASITLYSPDASEQANENWCARAEAGAMRTAYFYAPRTPDSLVLPENIAPEMLLDQCRLGFIWIEASDTDPLRASALADENKKVLSNVLGAWQPEANLQWWYSASWRQTAIWRGDDLGVVTAIANSPKWGEPNRSDRPMKVLLIAAGASSNITLERRSHEPDEFRSEQQRNEASRLEEAIRLVGADAAWRLMAGLTPTETFFFFVYD